MKPTGLFLFVLTIFLNVSVHAKTEIGKFFSVSSNGSVVHLNLTPNPKKPGHEYKQAGMQILTPDYKIDQSKSDCDKIIGNTQCIFSINFTKTVNITLSGSLNKPIELKLCLDDSGFTCQRYPVTLTKNGYLYVTNDGNNTVSACGLDANGNIENCHTEYGNGTFQFQLPGIGAAGGITLNAAHTLAYVSNFGSNIVSICPILNDGSFGQCKSSNGDGTFSNPFGSIAIDEQHHRAYVPNANFGNSNISICQINETGNFTLCNTQTDVSFNLPNQIVLNQQDTIAYMANVTSNIIACGIDPTTRLFASCNSLIDPSFNGTQGVSLSASGTYLYVSNADNTVSVCQTKLDGSLYPCSIESGNPPFSFPPFAAENVALFMTSNTGIGYIPNGAINFVYSCPMNTNGQLQPCKTSSGNGTFLSPSAVALY